MPKPSKQTAHLKQIRNIKKMNSDNELNKIYAVKKYCSYIRIPEN
ncbi:10445_t:CDS:1, partial [Entrophospora sp. SA101]